MKITKNKFAAASFGVALASLYSAPELCAQVDSDPTTVDFSLVPGTVPFFSGVVTDNPGVDVVFSGLESLLGYGNPVSLPFFNSNSYGFGVIDATHFSVLEPGDVFSGAGSNESNNRLVIEPTETGIRTIGFVFNGGVGYFRVDLGQPGDTVILLGGEVAVSADGIPANNDFTITVPGGDAVLLGDVNLDGVVDFLDIGPFIGRLSSNMFQAEADIDGSGVVDFLDIGPFIQILSGPSAVRVSWTDSTGKLLDRSAAGNEALERQLQAVEQKLNDELIAALAQASSSVPSSANEPKSASAGLASLASGANGLRRRRAAATTVA